LRKDVPSYALERARRSRLAAVRRRRRSIRRHPDFAPFIGDTGRYGGVRASAWRRGQDLKPQRREAAGAAFMRLRPQD
jgi:hypothetical protein